MEQLRTLWESHPYAVGAVLALPVVYLAHKQLTGRRQRPTVDCPANTVLLYQFSRGPYAPAMSNFQIKLETYLRMAKIPYINDFSGQFSPKGKTPFISYNGEVVSDSQFCIEYLNKKLNIDLNQDLTQEQRAIAKAFQILTDEHLYWLFAYFRWVYDKSLKIVKLAFPEFGWLLTRMIQRRVSEQVHGQGIGRHSPEEVKYILMVDLQTLTDFLGNKQFLMGATPCEVDCSVFGLLSQLVWHAADDVTRNTVQEKFPSLYNYTIRMKERFWPDWDDCITHGGTRPATK